MTDHPEPAPGTPGATRSWRGVLLVLAVVTVLALGMWMTVPPAVEAPAGAQDTAPAGDGRPTMPVVADIGGDFSLPSTRGDTLSLAALRGKVVLLNFGFLSCPDVCPLTLQRLAGVMQALEREAVDMGRVQVLFVTFDPLRDTLPALADYLAYFDKRFIGLRGDEAQTAAITRQYRVIHLRQDQGSAGGYVFSHTDFVYAIDTHGRVRLLVGSQDPERALVEAVKRLLREDPAK